MSELSPETVVSSQRIYEGKVVNLRVDQMRNAAGKEYAREVVEYPDSVVIVPVDAEGNALLVRQYRHPTGKILLEAPAGRTEQDESPEETAWRELQEETGYRPSAVRQIGAWYTSPGFCTEYMSAFLATGLIESRRQADEDESFTVEPVARDQIPGLIARGAICDSKTIAALLLWLAESRELSQAG